MDVLQTLFFVLFATLTLVGYKKNNRELMLMGAVFAAIGFVGLDFVLGFAEGIEGV